MRQRKKKHETDKSGSIHSLQVRGVWQITKNVVRCGGGDGENKKKDTNGSYTERDKCKTYVNTIEESKSLNAEEEEMGAGNRNFLRRIRRPGGGRVTTSTSAAACCCMVCGCYYWAINFYHSLPTTPKFW